MKIGILETGHVPEELTGRHGTYPDMFARLLSGHGFDFTTWPVVDGVFPPDIRACDGWLITGSRHGAYEPHPWIPPLEDFIRRAYAEGVPLAGICFGHQVMAQALGGKVEKFAGGWGVGRSRYRLLDNHGDGEELELHAMHQDQVTVAPAEARVIASSPFCRNAGLAYRGNAISFQPHPEFDAAFMRDLISARAGTLLPEPQASAALGGLGDEGDAAKIAARIAAFFRQAARVAA
ncbi:MAG: glutamine amidotransferase [Alphaproteobacteria bacterium]|nr:MAG: glutamine amidotransferase [Alphaproteobacteria bacterium]